MTSRLVGLVIIDTATNPNANIERILVYILSSFLNENMISLLYCRLASILILVRLGAVDSNLSEFLCYSPQDCIGARSVEACPTIFETCLHWHQFPIVSP